MKKALIGFLIWDQVGLETDYISVESSIESLEGIKGLNNLSYESILVGVEFGLSILKFFLQISNSASLLNMKTTSVCNK
jgi:hypothetical protein